MRCWWDVKRCGCGTQSGGPSKKKAETYNDHTPSNSSPGHTTKRTERRCSNNLSTNVHRTASHNSPRLETTQIPTNWSIHVRNTIQPHKRHFPGGSDGKESACNAGDPGSMPRSGRSSGEGNGNPPQYSCLQNPMDRGGWRVTAPGVTKSRIGLTNAQKGMKY